MNDYYDALFADEAGTTQYYEFLERHIQGNKVCELACGTGDLLHRLQQRYQAIGVDLDPQMIAAAVRKYPQLEPLIVVGDFLTFQSDQRFDTLICVGDSLNYILDASQLEQFVDHSLTLANTLILDSHHPSRISEFQQEYIEEGTTDAFDYIYQINTDQDFLIHTISFLDSTYTNVIQWVFDPLLLKAMYEARHCSVEMMTDFDSPGLQGTGEKIMYIITRKDHE